ncbi:4-hydroxy-3-methylbut-2-en-1-yl diphosphate synthase (flavodoxin) [Bacteroidia bacterium]|nr:4-hydroxy-3-methylbut-2-en-1-yl diphosphate synthase (flavodoxin) [Bacteroidia bacterium]
MLNTPTLDTEACVEQAIRIIEAGGQLVRLTAQNVKEAENLKNIHSQLRARGYTTPLSADIHFNPEAALVAARYVEKVRINPGNFVGFVAQKLSTEYATKRTTESESAMESANYAIDLKRLQEKFTPFLKVCREHGTAVRIGTNHGSLSERIMSRYGNTPLGMVEATMEYLRVCQDTGFENVVVSLKSSDCRTMIQAVRLLVKRMDAEGMRFPIHLGVTEAGEGEDGRIRSAVGIGALLNEGIGDTIRVSLTEAPEKEIPVAKEIIRICTPNKATPAVQPTNGSTVPPISVPTRQQFDPPTVQPSSGSTHQQSNPLAHQAVVTNLSDLASEPILEIECVEQIDEQLIATISENTIIVLAPSQLNYHVYRKMLYVLRSRGIRNKVVVKVKVDELSEAGEKNIKLAVACHVGGLFADRLASGLWIVTSRSEWTDEMQELSRNILQSAGLYRYKTEFISCPGCGRTLFDLQDAVAKVKKAFSHLPNLKIAVMGCVVNGPGEMGDADYGYVGAGNGKVNLYKGRVMVKAGVKEEEAVEELRQVIEN